MKYTENYGLLKPEGSAFYDINDHNNNMDIIDTELKTATNIAKGRNQALVYSTYAEMVAELNTMPSTELKVGQNIYIGAVGVPDLWIYGVSEESTEYVYISDEEIIEAVENNVSLQIGYYQIAFLETQKVDLTTIEDEISEVKEDVAELADSLGSVLTNYPLLQKTNCFDFSELTDNRTFSFAYFTQGANNSPPSSGNNPYGFIITYRIMEGRYLIYALTNEGVKYCNYVNGSGTWK